MIRHTAMNVVRIVLISLFALPSIAFARDKNDTPPCYGEENFATQTALVHMVSAGLIKNFASIYRDDQVPYRLKTRLLDSEIIGKYSAKDFPASALYRQIQKIDVDTKEGQSFGILTISDSDLCGVLHVRADNYLDLARVQGTERGEVDSESRAGRNAKACFASPHEQKRIGNSSISKIEDQNDQVRGSLCSSR